MSTQTVEKYFCILCSIYALMAHKPELHMQYIE